VEIGQLLSDGTLRAQMFEDTDSDGMLAFTADVDPGTVSVSPVVSMGWDILKPAPFAGSPIEFPLLATNVEQSEPLLVFIDPAALTGSPLALGQILAVNNGGTSSHPALDVRTNSSGVNSTAALLMELSSSFPAYTGEAVVIGLVRLTVVPEPATATLGLLAAGMLLVIRRRISPRVTIV
jgi:PEP-CTERM motif